MKIYFDLDDTLYFQYDAFNKAFQQIFHEDIDTYQLYLLSRQYNNQYFALAMNSQISFDEFYCQRIIKPCLQYNIHVSQYQARLFQKFYRYYQTHLSLDLRYQYLFDDCLSKGIEIGLITNGPYDVQMKKIKSLQLDHWMKHLFISGEIGISKPDIRLFDLARDDEKNCLFIGDSYHQDILPAKKSGFETIWFNHKHESYKEDKQVDNLEDLLKVIYHWIKKS